MYCCFFLFFAFCFFLSRYGSIDAANYNAAIPGGPPPLTRDNRLLYCAMVDLPCNLVHHEKHHEAPNIDLVRVIRNDVRRRIEKKMIVFFFGYTRIICTGDNFNGTLSRCTSGRRGRRRENSRFTTSFGSWVKLASKLWFRAIGAMMKCRETWHGASVATETSIR